MMYDEGNIGPPIPGKQRHYQSNESQSTERKRRKKTMSHAMVENSRFAMGYQSDNFYPPGMYAGYNGFS